MRFQLASAMIITFCLAACNGAKSPDTVAKDVATAEQKASTEVAKSEDSAAKDLNSAAGKVDDKVVAFNNAAAKDVYNLAIARGWDSPGSACQLRVCERQCAKIVQGAGGGRLRGS
jgi:hypothetical protein